MSIIKMKKRTLGIIPARGGSKGVPKKNIQKINGKELIYYTIQACQESHFLTDFIVTSDSQEIMKICENYGAKVPFLRPPELATDSALAIPTLQHAYRTYTEMQNHPFDYVMMLQPTSPLRTGKHIDDCIKIICESNCDSVISVTSVQNNHPYKMKKIVDGLLVDYVETGLENPPRQSLPDIYIVNGVIYLTTSSNLMEKNTLKGHQCHPFIMGEKESCNVDTKIDLKIAEYLLNRFS